MRLFNIFNKKNVASTSSGSTLFYHEDDFCQIELSPKENLSLFQAESEEISDLAAKDDGKSGFTEMYVRNDNRVTLSKRKIKTSELEEILQAFDLEKSQAVTTGYGQYYRKVRKRTIGFGKDYSAFYFDYEGGVVKHIWLTGLFGFDKEKIIELLHLIGQKWNLILMDWNQTRAVDLSNKNYIESYLTD